MPYGRSVASCLTGSPKPSAATASGTAATAPRKPDALSQSADIGHVHALPKIHISLPTPRGNQRLRGRLRKLGRHFDAWLGGT